MARASHYLSNDMRIKSVRQAVSKLWTIYDFPFLHVPESLPSDSIPQPLGPEPRTESRGHEASVEK